MLDMRSTVKILGGHENEEYNEEFINGGAD